MANIDTPADPNAGAASVQATPATPVTPITAMPGIDTPQNPNGVPNIPVTPAIVPNPTPVTTINTANTANTTPVTAPAPNTAPTAAAEAALQASLAAFSANLKTATATTDTTGGTGDDTGGGTLQDTLKQLLGLQTKLAGKSGETANINNSVGLDQKTQAAQTAQNNYNAREQYYNDAIEKMQTSNPQGLSQDAVNENVQNLTRQKNSELADLAIIKSAADGDATTAQAIATQKVNAEFQPIQDQIDNLKTIYSLQENDMTDSEKQQATAAIAAKQSQADEQKQMRLDAYAETIKQNDPLYKEQVANEARLAAGGGTKPTAQDALAQYATKFVVGAKLPNGNEVIDPNGYITPEAFKAAIADAPANGLTRAQFITNFASQLYSDPKTGYAAYGLTPAEQKLITGALPDPNASI